MGLIRRRSSFFFSSSSSSPLKCFGFSFATTVPRETSEKRAHKTHNAHKHYCSSALVFYRRNFIFDFFYFWRKSMDSGRFQWPNLRKTVKNCHISNTQLVFQCVWLCSQNQPAKSTQELSPFLLHLSMDDRHFSFIY